MTQGFTPSPKAIAYLDEYNDKCPTNDVRWRVIADWFYYHPDELVALAKAMPSGHIAAVAEATMDLDESSLEYDSDGDLIFQPSYRIREAQ